MMPSKMSVETDYVQREKLLEFQELEAAGGVASPQTYGQLLAVYLLQNDTTNAKFLWKRIPSATKTANAELSQIWAIGQKMWQRDFPGIYESLNKEWTEPLKPIMASILETTRQRAFTLVSQAYSSISGEDFAAFMGMPINDAVNAAVARGWQADAQTRIILPKKTEAVRDPVIPSEQQLARLTDFVAFLEN